MTRAPRAAAVASLVALSGCGPIVAVVLHPDAGCWSMATGDSTSLTAEAFNEAWLAYTSRDKPHKFSWRSSDPDIMSVSSRGIARAHALGKATLTAEAEGKVGSFELKIVEAKAKARITPTYARMKVRDTVLYTVSATDLNDVPIAPDSVRISAAGARFGVIDIMDERGPSTRVAAESPGIATVAWNANGRCGLAGAIVRR